MISLSRLGTTKDYKRARVRAGKENYKRLLTDRFPRRKSRDLPIVGQDFTYYMDIMYLSAFSEEDTAEMKKRKTYGVNVREMDYLHQNEMPGYAPNYSCALVIVEGTTRKAWAFPLHTKDAREVLYAFKIFLRDIDMRIAKLMSDMGKEYNKIKDYNEKHHLFHYFQANASQNMHTTLSRVDRFIRTLRSIIRQYYTLAYEPNWVVMLRTLVDCYNNTPHNSLFLRDPTNKNKKIFYTPQQVWKNPELRRRIKLKDYLAKYKHYKFIDKYFKEGSIVRYRILPGQLKNLRSNGYISQYLAIIREKIGNSFIIQLKKKQDIDRDNANKVITNFTGHIIVAPARDLIPYVPETKIKKPKSKYNINNLLFDVHSVNEDPDNPWLVRDTYLQGDEPPIPDDEKIEEEEEEEEEKEKEKEEENNNQVVDKETKRLLENAGYRLKPKYSKRKRVPNKNIYNKDNIAY